MNAVNPVFRASYNPERLKFVMDLEIPNVCCITPVEVSAYWDATDEPEQGFVPGWIVSCVTYKGYRDVDITDIIDDIEGATELIQEECDSQ